LVKKKAVAARASAIDTLFARVVAILEQARARVVRSVNREMILAYWHIGREVIEHQQGGHKRAAYGEVVLEQLSHRLTAAFGRGFDVTNLRKMRQFYRMFEIRDALRLESADAKRDTPRLDSDLENTRLPVSDALSWSHYRLLMKVESLPAREWYLREAASQQWSTRQLERQISVLYYERLLASRRKGPVRKEAIEKLAVIEPEQFIRDPYVLDFLGLTDYPALRESSVEQAIIDNLQAFLLELGRGFSFVARQKRMRFEEEDFYVDLVFYNYVLRCFVLIDLKVGKLTHQDIGQMESYVRMFDANRPPGDNPTIGLILCSKKNEAIARYSVLSENRQIFAAKYVHVLPTEDELRRELERERRLVENNALRGDQPKESL
jgi:predicted nuclease of restriction endonuclease-like (RecB) superfamily